MESCFVLKRPLIPLIINNILLVRIYNCSYAYTTYPGVQRFSGVRDLGGDEAEKTSGRDLSNFISMT